MKKTAAKIIKKKSAKIFVISGPGGAGKTTLVNKIFQAGKIQEAFIKGITVTTRLQRPQEIDGRDYFFVSKEEFLRLRAKKFFLESQKVLDNYYGTPKLFYDLASVKKKDLVLCIDVKGGMYLKRNNKPDKIITLFIGAPTQQELYLRMGKRKEGEENIKRRIELAEKETKYVKLYDYAITNKSIEKAAKQVKEIMLKYASRHA
ncbi:MAG: guanylate kinase [Candidatus Omnitrophica bacterium]|nr:guanylate kinase [Candidatus Omnitrophota bacterium]MDD5430097.1 guanylate kinase [Candidatus Omnitrophota bacterium]